MSAMAETQSRRARRRFTDEFKQQAAHLAQPERRYEIVDGRQRRSIRRAATGD